MRLLCISDIHSDIGGVKKIKKRFLHNKIDLVVIAGDFSNEGSTRIVEQIIEELSFARILAVPGNMDTGEILELLEGKGMSLHKKRG